MSVNRAVTGLNEIRILICLNQKSKTENTISDFYLRNGECTCILYAWLTLSHKYWLYYKYSLCSPWVLFFSGFRLLIQLYSLRIRLSFVSSQCHMFIQQTSREVNKLNHVNFYKEKKLRKWSQLILPVRFCYYQFKRNLYKQLSRRDHNLRK